MILIKTCSESIFGCCPDGKTAAQGPSNAGCPSEYDFLTTGFLIKSTKILNYPNFTYHKHWKTNYLTSPVIYFWYVAKATVF